MPRHRPVKFLLLVVLLNLVAGSSFAESEYEKGWDNFRAGNYKLARTIWIPLAKQGDADAAMGLAIIYENGLQTPRDTRESTRWYRVAAEYGIPEAQHDLGIKYFTGEGVQKDLKKTYELWSAAAEKGLGRAQSKLAYLYLNGLGIAKNEAEALRWYRQAANQGNTESMYNLSLMYKMGTGTEVNTHQYHYWLKKAAELDYAPAQYDLGLMMLYGKDMERSVSGGKDWLIRAANNGHAESQYHLGTLYMNGHVLRPDKDKAVMLLTAAANQGHMGAKQSLADMRYQRVKTSSSSTNNVASGKPVSQPSTAKTETPKGIVLGGSPVGQTAQGKTPVKAKSMQAGTDRTRWLGEQPPDRYTIQLIASQDKDSLKKFIDKLPRSIDAYIYRYTRGKDTWTAVATGIYKDRDTAKQAVARLPANIRKNKPWVRQIGPIQQYLTP